MIVLNNRLSTTMLLLTIPCVLNIWLNQWILTEVEWLMVKRVGLQRRKISRKVGRMQYFVKYALHCLASTRTSFVG